MATTTLTNKHQKITVPANTSEHEINFDNVLDTPFGTAMVELVSGTSVQVSGGTAIDSTVGALTSAEDKVVLDVRRGLTMKFKGGAGSETFNVSILRA